jgi:hypothetical protein
MAGVQLLRAADMREMIWEWRSEWEAEAGLRARGWPGRAAAGPSRRRRASTRRPRPEAGRPQPAGGGGIFIFEFCLKETATEFA